MKQVILLFSILLLTIYTANAQAPFSSYIYVNFDSADTHSYISTDTSRIDSKWQIGTPDKSIFNASVVANNVIVTDTVNNCIPNDTSVFNLTVPTSMFYPIEGLRFRHQLDMDSGSLAKIEMGFTTNDRGWITLTGSACNCSQWDARVDTLYGNTSTQGWDTVDINLHFIFNERWQNHTIDDSTIFKFTYTSNDTSLGRNGWMIDDIYVYYMWEGSVKDIEENALNIYPNPSAGIFYLNPQSKTACTGIVVFDMQGREVYRTDKMLPDGKLILDVPNGIYTLKYLTSKSISIKQIIITR